MSHNSPAVSPVRHDARVLFERRGAQHVATERWTNNILAGIAPKSPTYHWLTCAYFAGDPWDLVERYVIYEMIPRRVLWENDRMIRTLAPGERCEFYAALTGPNPRADAFYVPARRRLYYRSEFTLPPVISLEQWRLFREHDALAVPRWIVEGSTGGHKRSFSMPERQTLALTSHSGLPTAMLDAPAMGSLAFAYPDTRSFDQLRRMDRLKRWNRLRSWRQRTMNDTWSERAEDERQFLRALGAYLDAQIADVAREYKHLIANSELPEAPDGYYRDREDVEEAWENAISTDTEQTKHTPLI